MTTEDLQQLFSLDVECPSDTHRTCDCTRCPDVHRKIEENTTSTMMNHSSISSEDNAIGGGGTIFYRKKSNWRTSTKRN